jgi:hypothetical protein
MRLSSVFSCWGPVCTPWRLAGAERDGLRRATEEVRQVDFA